MCSLSVFNKHTVMYKRYFPIQGQVIRSVSMFCVRPINTMPNIIIYDMFLHVTHMYEIH